mmetsp:Transcript_49146/g.56663  ORF Transcript_49146/g.56663 Transcript_49146/m.56663 type:complete len:622 (-) Transcript_49146:49-1914(-)
MAERKNNDESSLYPTIASLSPNNRSPNKDVQAARRGLLKAIFQTSIAPRFSSIPIDLQANTANFSAGAFSSKPIEMDGYFSSDPVNGGSFVRQNSCVTIGTNTDGSVTGSKHTDEKTRLFKNSLHQESSYLTPSERGYLQGLLQSDDLDSIRRASARLSDKELFPTSTDGDDEIGPRIKNDGWSAVEVEEEALNKEASTTTKSNNIQLPTTQRRRDSQVQEQLLEWHEKTTIMPSAVLKRMSSKQSVRKTAPLPAGSRTIPLNNSLTQDDNYEAFSIAPTATGDTIGPEENEYQDEKSFEEQQQQLQDVYKNVPHEDETWNSDVLDLNSWIARTEGVEVDEEGHPTTPTNITTNPFKILGTSANDVSCQPMVLSPPLMEGLQLFMPESLQENHYWLKYSLVRDGPGLMKMLRHCRGSQHTILAIESNDGHVFGSFTSQPWRLIGNNHYYGSKESFVWRMRQSRFEPCESVVEQIFMESKMDVFPFTSQNNKVQSCTASGIALGYGEVKEERMTQVNQNDINETVAIDSTDTKHYGHAIELDKSMTSGSTSSSETFGSPCLIERESRGEIFEVANVELWSLTPHDTVEEADQTEMKVLFLEENRQNDSNLNLIEILVGTHRS